MATFKLSVDLDNAAFECGSVELERILWRLAAGLPLDLDVGERGTIRDANGNAIGEWEVTP